MAPALRRANISLRSLHMNTTRDPFQSRDDRAGLWIFGIFLMFVLFCLFTSGCALSIRSTGHLYVGAHPYKQCDLPMLYAVSEALPDAQFNLINQAFEYWNTVLGFKAFVSADRVPYEPGDPEADGFIMVGYGRVPEGTVSTTGD